ncbi:hypothetical protein [Escherichia phage AV112]|nr:hypothetical protein [Escherichia phage AV112]WPK34890.1 hypothetical protein [Escherichia phage AV113]
MAQILPLNTDLGEDMEGASIDVLFTPQLETTETLVSINITDYEPTQGITVDGNRLYGTYESVFSFSSDALKYRLNDDFETASSWDDLPKDESTQLYLWRAPQNLRKVFSYTVEMIYNYQEESSSGGSRSDSGTEPPPAPVQKTLTKVYTKTIVGNWSKWARQLRNYVYVRP